MTETERKARVKRLCEVLDTDNYLSLAGVKGVAQAIAEVPEEHE